MLHGPVRDTRKNNSQSMSSSQSVQPLAGVWERPNPLVSHNGIDQRGEIAGLQKTYGNQAVLRMLNPALYSSMGKSGFGMSESFYGPLNDHLEKEVPSPGPVGTPSDAGSPATPVDKGADKKPKAPDCKDICDRAYKDSSLNTGGGGVVCDGATKCACAFDVPPLTRGQCPDFDKIVLTHETKHVKDNNSDCDPKLGLHRAKVRDESKLTETECTHRKASIKELDAAIPKNKGDCKAGMESIRDLLKDWVTANC